MKGARLALPNSRIPTLTVESLNRLHMITVEEILR